MRIFIYTYLLRPLLEMKEPKSRVFVIHKLTLTKVPKSTGSIKNTKLQVQLYGFDPETRVELPMPLG